VNDPLTGNVVITGTVTEDEILTADISAITDDDGVGTITYQWQRDGADIDGETASTHTLVDGDVGSVMTVRVSYIDGNGTTESTTSAATAAVANVNDALTGSVVITGTAAENEILTADTSGITDDDGLGTFNYQWQRDGVDIDGETASNFTLTGSDVGSAITVQVNYTDANGTDESTTSDPTAAVDNVNDAVAGNVVISGVVTEDEILTADVSGLTDEDGLGDFSYQWQRDDVDIGGAIGSTYTLGDADVGAAITVQVSYTDDAGTPESITSAATTAVTNINDALTGDVVITGVVTEDEILTADTSGITDADGLGAFSYQWQRNGANVNGATASTYTLVDEDVGSVITVQVSYTDGQGTAELTTSAATAAVRNANEPLVGNVLITGTAAEDQLLTADTSGITDGNGVGAFSYQWLRNDAPMSGANASTYSLGEADVGTTIRVQVSYTDADGWTESIASAATAAVTNVNDLPIGQGELLTIDEDGSITEDVANGLLLNDSDPDAGDVLHVSEISNGTDVAEPGAAIAGTAGGGFVINEDGSYEFDAIDDFQDLAESEQRTTQVTYTIADGQGGHATVNLSVNVTGANDQTIAIEDIGNTAEDTPLTETSATGVLANDSDIDASDQLLVASVSNGTEVVAVGESIAGDQGGVFVIQADGTYTFAPGADFLALDSGQTRSTQVSYTVSDGRGGSATASLTVVVAGLAPTPLEGGDLDVGIPDDTSDDETETPVVEEPADPVPGEDVEDIVDEVDEEPGGVTGGDEVVEDDVPDVDETPDADEPDVTEIPVGNEFLFGNVGTTEVSIDAPEIVASISTFELFEEDDNDNVEVRTPATVDRMRSEFTPLRDPTVLMSSQEFLRGLDNVRDEVAIEIQAELMVVGGGFALTTGLSVGYVVWLARSGILLSSLLTSLPAWQFMDPLPVLASMQGGFDDDDDDESLEAIVESEFEEVELESEVDIAVGEAELDSESESGID
jgi:hypothetical protein